MKKHLSLTVLTLVLATVFVATASAQSLKGMTLNGATGLISLPSGRIGWERSAEIGFDLGYHAVLDSGENSHLPKASISLFRVAEISFVYDTQEDSDNSDIVIGGKIQLPTSGTAVALGGNFQMLQRGGTDDSVAQIYLAATYPGTFFRMPAETTFVIGKSFGDSIPDGNIDFGMGFDLLLFPDIFQGYVHWINDFSNFSYSADPYAANAANRGVFNTGVRIDLAANPNLRRYKFVIDALLTDTLDDERAFALGLAFGAPIR